MKIRWRHKFFIGLLIVGCLTSSFNSKATAENLFSFQSVRSHDLLLILKTKGKTIKKVLKQSDSCNRPYDEDRPKTIGNKCVYFEAYPIYDDAGRYLKVSGYLLVKVEEGFEYRYPTAISIVKANGREIKLRPPNNENWPKSLFLTEDRTELMLVNDIYVGDKDLLDPSEMAIYFSTRDGKFLRKEKIIKIPQNVNRIASYFVDGD